MEQVEFGATLRERREGKGLTQEQLASQADLSTRYIQSLEANEKSPSMETLFKIARALNTSPGPLVDPAWRAWKTGR